MIGQCFWHVKHTPVRVIKTCDFCLGLGTVTVLDNSNNRYVVNCEACRQDWLKSTGQVEEWVNTPEVEAFIIGSVTAYRDGKWTVKSATDDRTIDFEYLYSTHTEAMAQAEARCEALRENNYGQRKRARENAKSKAASTAAYHRSKVRKLREELAWHEAKLGMKAC
jgi:hypothetical protein